MAKKANQPGVGIDIIETERFTLMLKPGKKHQLNKFFTETEIKYCLGFKDAAVRLAGHFAAKEAVSKALGVREFPWLALEIRHNQNGAPEVWKNQKKLSVKISISHIKNFATAVAII